MALFPNRYGEVLTRFGAFRQLKKLVQSQHNGHRLNCMWDTYLCLLLKRKDEK